jgi:hypothetical protein
VIGHFRGGIHLRVCVLRRAMMVLGVGVLGWFLLFFFLKTPPPPPPPPARRLGPMDAERVGVLPTGCRFAIPQHCSNPT